jgi:site-specific DNA recombinase
MNADEDALRTWATQRRPRTPRRFIAGPPGLRFAFYGRMSTVDYQDRASSWRWRYHHASDLIDGHGRIVIEFFAEGVSQRSRGPSALRPPGCSRR